MFCIPSTRNNFFQTFDKKTPGQKICFIYFIFSLKKAKQRKKKDFHENVAAFISRHAKCRTASTCQHSKAEVRYYNAKIRRPSGGARGSMVEFRPSSVEARHCTLELGPSLVEARPQNIGSRHSQTRHRPSTSIPPRGERASKSRKLFNKRPGPMSRSSPL